MANADRLANLPLDWTGEVVSVPVEPMRASLTTVFGAVGADEEQSRLLADAIVDAELCEVPTHGLLRVPGYLAGLGDGVYSATTDLVSRTVSDSLQLIDGRHMFGHLPTWRGAIAACAMAARTGVGIVGISNIGEFGRAAFYVEEMARRGCVGIVCQNSSPLLASPGSTIATHGNNPIAFSGPGDDAPLFDAALTPRSGGEVWRRSVLGLGLPSEWGYVDDAGQPTADPDAALGAIFPALGGGKGFGLAVMVDLLAGILTGAASGTEATSDGWHRWTADGTRRVAGDDERERPNVGAMVIALDPGAFGTAAVVEAQFHRSAGAVRGHGGRWPGDRSRAARARNTARGAVDVPAPIYALVREVLDGAR